MARIYVASSWRNPYQENVVSALRLKGYKVYDFKNPPHTGKGFTWEEIDPKWRSWTAPEVRYRLLVSPIAARGFLSDLRGLQWCDTCVLVMPCGRSAHLEAGWSAGAGKRVIVLLEHGPSKGTDPELMWLFANDIVLSISELVEAI